MAENQGLKTQFSSGDRVRMSWREGEDGLYLSLAKAEAGASREELDLTKSIKGEQSWFGNESQLVNLVSQRGVLSVDGQGLFNARNFIGLLKRSGAEHVARELSVDLSKRDKGNPVFLESAAIDPNTGKLAAFSLRRGGEMEREDYVKDESGKFSRRVNLDVSQSGRIHTVHDESRSILERGPVTSPSSMWSAAVSGDRVLASRVINAPTNAVRNQELQEQAKKFASAAAERLSKEGVLVSESNYSAGGGLGIGKKGAIFHLSGQAGVFHRNAEQDNYNRIYRDIRRAQDDLVGRFNKGGMTREQFGKEYTNIFGSYAAEVERLVKGMNDSELGASSLVTRPAGIPVGDAISSAVKDLGKPMAETGVGKGLLQGARKLDNFLENIKKKAK